VSSIIYGKAKKLIPGGANGKLNLIDAWREGPVDSDELVFRNSIASEAAPAMIDCDRCVGRTCASVPVRPVVEFLAPDNTGDRVAHMDNFFEAKAGHYKRKVCGWNPKAKERI